MFGNYFYYEKTKIIVNSFGHLFNNIYITRKRADNSSFEQVRVPVAYGPRSKYLDRLRENPSIRRDTETALKLPRISFQIAGFQYDNQRVTQKVNSFTEEADNPNTRNRIYNAVPYNVLFQLSIYVKTQDEGWQILEQILPTFTPQYSLTINPFGRDRPEFEEDIPIILQEVDYSDDFEGTLGARRAIMHNLRFQAKMKYYSFINSESIIRDSRASVFDLNRENPFVDLLNIRFTSQDSLTIELKQDNNLVNSTNEPIKSEARIHPNSQDFTTTANAIQIRFRDFSKDDPATAQDLVNAINILRNVNNIRIVSADNLMPDDNRPLIIKDNINLDSSGCFIFDIRSNSLARIRVRGEAANEIGGIAFTPIGGISQPITLFAMTPPEGKILTNDPSVMFADNRRVTIMYNNANIGDVINRINENPNRLVTASLIPSHSDNEPMTTGSATLPPNDDEEINFMTDFLGEGQDFNEF